jgi:hypothetical protein
LGSTLGFLGIMAKWSLIDFFWTGLGDIGQTKKRGFRVCKISLAKPVKSSCRETTAFFNLRGIIFEEAPTSEQVLSEIAENRTAKKRKRLSESKCTLIQLLISYQDGQLWRKADVTIIFNELLYPKVKSIK